MIRKATMQDLPAIVDIYAYARNFMVKPETLISGETDIHKRSCCGTISPKNSFI